MHQVVKGVWRYCHGETELHTPIKMRNKPISENIENLASANQAPINQADIKVAQTSRGLKVELPLQADEQIYGFGLQLHRMNHTGRKKHIRVNSDPIADTGDSHAPVPFYVSNAGYGVLVDTLRYCTFYTGTNLKKGESEGRANEVHKVGTSEIELYGYEKTEGDRQVLVDIPAAKGIDIYIFEGPDLLSAVKRYNLFSGGGTLPPLWGLGMWYRAYSAANSKDIKRLAEELRQSEMPVDVFGFEPGWQTKAYSASFVWDNNRYPNYQSMIDTLTKQHYKVNLWEHIFVHPTSPMYQGLKPFSGDFEVWQGLVPDLAVEEAKNQFANYHLKTFVNKGISGFKLDECDSSDFVHSNWSFPDLSYFPSGLDGEQMHNQIGLLYQDTIERPFEQIGKRTWSQVRASGALASPYPFVLYSDLYNHRDFIRGVVNSGFSGLLWTPEVRDASSPEDLIRRIEAVILSPMALLNCWRLPNLPWLQVDLEKNVNGEFDKGYEETRAICKHLFKFRMSLIPYLYAAFSSYYEEGTPPFRALVMDYPDDPQTFTVDDQYMMGANLLIAPLISDQTKREVYLPTGSWYDFWTNELLEGNQTLTIKPKLGQPPIYVKENTLLPLAKPVQYVTDQTVFELVVNVYGAQAQPFSLHEDDGESLAYKNKQSNQVILHWNANSGGQLERAGQFESERYLVTKWRVVHTEKNT
ncbi:alpha-D-xyloside xylohydrolase [Amphibacillus marinus]|uniref:Alpha-D-xyloside xylohydrolase n=1 Tax=Amphibacillus marinus TaxID=872970 RepID=A0A1H8RA64_9BACI|nr:TIM-barrel domain-containing protein [Amphibacillus marinus]SEO63335.1 alpha-D-xyloside xylohydrolase [Amphibacillus marinus]